MPASMPSAHPEGSVVYVNGNIYTVDKAQPRAGGFIVCPKGLFTAVGSTAVIKATAQAENLVVYDLHGEFVMPGIHDAHVHTFHSGLHLLGDILMEFATKDGADVADRMKSGFGGCAYHGVHSDWIIGVLLEIENYDRAMLDNNWPDKPVVIHAAGGQLKYLNKVALEKAGFDIQNEPDAEMSVLGRRSDGSLTGSIGGKVAMGRANMAVPRPTVVHLKKAIKRAMKDLYSSGVTSCQEAAANTILLEVLHELDAEGRLKMDYATHILYKNEWLSGEILSDPEELIASADCYLSTHVNTRFVKFMMDGVPGSKYVLQHASLDEDGKPDMCNILEPNLP